MIHLPGVLAAAEDVQAFCQRHHWGFCFIGGVALQRWGEPRLTQDVDLTLLTGFGREEEFERVLTRQHGKLDLKQIRAELKPLLELKGEPESLDKLEGKIATVERRLKAK